jgi:hypothetical protein
LNYTERYGIERNEDKINKLLPEFISTSLDTVEYTLREEGGSLAIQNLAFGKQIHSDDEIE